MQHWQLTWLVSIRSYQAFFDSSKTLTQTVCAEEVQLAHEVCTAESLVLIAAGEQQYVAKEGSTGASAFRCGGRGSRRGGGRAGQGRGGANADPESQPMCHVLTESAMGVYAQTTHGRKRMIASDATAEASAAIADAEAEDVVDDCVCGFDEDGGRLVEDDAAAFSFSVMPDRELPSVERKAAVVRAAAALEAQPTFNNGTAAAPAGAVAAPAVATAAAAPPAPPRNAELKYATSIIEGWKRMLIAMVSYIHEHTEFLTQYPFRAASFVHRDGSDMFAEDMHLSSDACGRTCPSRCRF